MKSNRLNPLKKQLHLLQQTTPPSPWRRVSTIAIGGLRAVGFDRSSEYLLVISSAGRGVIDCRTGEKVARNTEEYDEDEEDLDEEIDNDDIDDFEEVVKLDVQYIDNWSIWMDIYLLFKTVGVVFDRKGAK